MLRKRVVYLFSLTFLLFFYFSCAPTYIRLKLPSFVKVKPPVIRVGIYIGEINEFSFHSEGKISVYSPLNLIGKTEREVLIKRKDNSFSVYFNNREHVIDSERIYLVPDGKTILYGKREYKGVILILRTGIQTAVINLVNLEDYVEGVIPYEIPEKFRNIDFLKAQAISIRSYAFYQMMNKNKYKSLGFDICSSYLCQVYNGVKRNIDKNFIEAVKGTRGKVLTWEGKPALTLYSAFCGGNTEDAKVLFKKVNAPYLKGRKVYDFDFKEEIITAKEVFDSSSEIDLFLNLGIIDLLDKQKLNKKINREMLLKIFRKLSIITGKRSLRISGEINFLKLLELIDLFFDVSKRARIEISAFEIRNFWESAIEKRTKIVYKYLLSKRIIRKIYKSTYIPTLKEAIVILSRTLSMFYKVYDDAVFNDFASGEIELLVSGEEKKFELKNTHIYLIKNEFEYPVKSIILTGIEKLKIFTIKNKVKIIKVYYPEFNYDPESSKFFPLWVKVYKANELEKRLMNFYNTGKLYDIAIISRGNSFRVNKIEVQTEMGNFTIDGVDVKYRLGLKDTFFILNRVFDKEGYVKQFIFIGMGNGHGVGMCQIEAYLLSKKGMDYKEILSTFYSGTSIEDVFSILKKIK